MRFEWNNKKAQLNITKHGVTFEEASSVFYDDFSRTVPDPFSSFGEARFLTLGLSVSSNVLLVVHTEIEESCIRIISARHATKAERSKYEQYR